MAITIPVRAGGDINPSRFVTVDTTARHTVVESNSGDTKILGISDEATKNAPQTGSSSLAAESGDQFRMHAYGSDPLLELGTGGCTAGDFLKPDNDGKGVTAGAADVAGAIALETGSAGEKVKVQIVLFSVPA